MYSGNLSDTKPDLFALKNKIYLKVCSERDKKVNEVIETFHYKIKNVIKSMTIAKVDIKDDKDKIAKVEGFGGKTLSGLEKKGFNQIVIKLLEIEKNIEIASATINGLLLKSYRFDKYKTQIKKNSNVKLLKILDENSIFNKSKKINLKKGNSVKGVFLTRDLVSEPANILFPKICGCL